MTSFQFYLLAQVYGSGTYGGSTYQCTGDQCETQTAQQNVSAPSTGVLRQESSVTAIVIVAIVALSLLTAAIVLYAKKRIRKNK